MLQYTTRRMFKNWKTRLFVTFTTFTNDFTNLRYYKIWFFPVQITDSLIISENLLFPSKFENNLLERNFGLLSSKLFDNSFPPDSLPQSLKSSPIPSSPLLRETGNFHIGIVGVLCITVTGERRSPRGTTPTDIFRIHIWYGIEAAVYWIIASLNISVADETGMGSYIK